MLQIMRKHARNWLMKVLLGIIIVVFIFYFGAMRGRNKTETIAIIGKKHITYPQFNEEYRKTIESLRQRYGNNLSDSLIKAIKPKEQALSTLINREILLLEADRMNLHVGDAELKSAISSFPAFQNNGVFDRGRYLQILRQNRLTPEEFEASQKMIIRLSKLERLIRESVKVPESEVYDIYRMQNEEINLSFVEVPSQNFRPLVKTSKEKLEAYLKNNGEYFRKGKAITVSYLKFSGDHFGKDIQIPEEEITDYYDSHIADFTDDKGKEAPFTEVYDTVLSKLRFIKGMDKAQEAAEDTHDIIYQEENFEAAAKEMKLEIHKADLSFDSELPKQLAYLKDLRKTLFDMEKGELSKVFSDDTGHYLFKVAETRPSYIPGLTDIEVEVKEAYIAEESEKLSRQKAEKILDKTRKGSALSKVASAEGFSVLETGLFVPGSDIPKIGMSQELGKVLFELSEKNPYPNKVFFADGKAFVVIFKEHGKLDDKDWDSKKENLRKALMQMKGNSYFQMWLEDTRNSMIKQGSLEIKVEADKL